MFSESWSSIDIADNKIIFLIFNTILYYGQKFDIYKYRKLKRI